MGGYGRRRVMNKLGDIRILSRWPGKESSAGLKRNSGGGGWGGEDMELC